MNVARVWSGIVLAACLGAALGGLPASADAALGKTPGAQHPVWVTGYYLSGDGDSGRLPVSAIDFHALTHIIDFCLFPNPDGSLIENITPAQSRELIPAAHDAGCKVLVSLGAQGDGSIIRAVTTNPVTCAALVKNLVHWTIARGYDGIDLDYEPLEPVDKPNYARLVTGLRREMDAEKPGLLLTAAMGGEAGQFAALQDNFDQLNLMTYDLAGMGKADTWFNSAIYSDPRGMDNGKPYSSIDRDVRIYEAAGIQPSKLGIGGAFGGLIWTGVSGPRQPIRGKPYVSVDDDADYTEIMEKYSQPPYEYRWDSQAAAPYFTLNSPNPKDRRFVSYDDERCWEMKVAYARQHHIGGVMIWELGGGYLKDRPAGQRDELLQAIKAARLNPALADPKMVGNTIW